VVIDDDRSVRKALRRLIRSVGMAVTTHASAEEFLAAGGNPAPGCLILDVRLPGMSGLNLQRLLAESRRDIAVIIMTALEDPSVRGTALGAGAVDFVTKPFDRDRMLAAVSRAIAQAESSGTPPSGSGPRCEQS
jgi:FixJ family two-component response regulator